MSGGSKLAKITDGAVSFDGSGDYLTVPYAADTFSFGTGDFTIESYVNMSAVQYTAIISSTSTSINATNHWLLGFSNTANMMSFKIDGSGNSSITSDFSGYYSKWTHVAVSRESGTIRLFFDGIEKASATDTSSLTGDSGNAVKIGQRYTNQDAYSINGFISNIRILKGTALYTANFTPPTRTLTNVTNTKLLCCQSNSEGPQKTAVIPPTTGTATAMWPLNSDINDDSGNSNNLSETGGSTSFISAGTNPFGLSNCADFAADGKYLSYAVTPASAWTIDGYIKFDDVSSGSNSYVLGWNGTNGSDTTIGLVKADSTFAVWGSSNLNTTTVAEVGRWYHVRLTTNGTSDLALYVNGVLAGRSASSNGSPASPITIGDMQSGRFNGQIAGVRYTPTDLGAPPLGGETTSSGVTSNSPSAGVGLAGNVAATNFNPFNTDINTVRGQETGYNTLNPLAKASITLSNGNLDLTHSGSTGYWQLVLSTIGMSSGKFYCEFLCQDADSVIGIAKGNHVIANDKYVGQDPGGYSYNGQNGQKINNSSGSSYGSSYAAGDVIGIAFDGDNGTLRFYKNNIDQGQAFSGLTDEYYFAFSIRDTGYTHSVNFGQKPFKFPPPDGFQPLNAANVRPETVISRPDQYVGATLWTGNGGAQTVSGLNHSPDLIWHKIRTITGGHQLYDSVRGVTKRLRSDTTDNESTVNGVTAFNFDGWSMTGGNNSGEDYVSWTWKAGGNKNTFNVDDVGYANASDVGMSVGALNSAFYNTSQVWSDDITKGTGNVYSNNIYVPVNIFNGNTSSYCKVEKGSNSNTVSMQLSSTISGVTKIRVNTNSVDNFNINGGSNIASTNGYQTIYEGSAITLSDLDFTRTNGVSSGNSDTGFFVYSIEINGLELLDSGVTPSTNFPSIAATGASVGTKQGFSIIKFTGSGSGTPSIPHGLSEAPTFIIQKDTGATTSWRTFLYNISTWSIMNLNNQDGATGATETAPTSSLFYANGNGNAANTQIAYLWHNVPGLQKFGTFEGNGNADGPFVELGFRPSILLVRNIDNSGTGYSWSLYDNERGLINPNFNFLCPDSSNKENRREGDSSDNTDRYIDFLSNGFKMRANNANFNANAHTIFYAAWAEAPTFNLYGAQSNAR